MSDYGERDNGDPRLPSSGIFPIVLDTRAVVVGADRSLTFEQDQPREANYSEILEKLQCPDFETKEILRAILGQMMLIIIDMKAHENDPNAAFYKRGCLADFKALQALIKQVERIDHLCQCDVLDFDGPKFQYVFRQLADYFKQAVLKALGTDSEGKVQRIMMELRDIVAMKDEELRRNTEKIPLLSSNSKYCFFDRKIT